MPGGESGLRVATVASIGYTIAYAAGTALSLRRNYTAEPLGIRTGRTPRQDAKGLGGAALAAPWNMIVQLWLATAISHRHGHVGRRGRAWLAFLASMLLAGAVAEPVSHRIVPRQLPVADAVVATLNIVLPVAILGGALTSLSGAEPGGD